MRAFLYDLLTTDAELQSLFGWTLEEAQDRVIPRQSEESINIPAPYIVYGLGNNTNEALAEDTDHTAHRQFFQVWIYDEGGDYGLIDDAIPVVKRILVNAHDTVSKVTTILWLETSAEFYNETYNKLFRYIRFQAIVSEGKRAA